MNDSTRDLSNPPDQPVDTVVVHRVQTTTIRVPAGADWREHLDDAAWEHVDVEGRVNPPSMPVL